MSKVIEVSNLRTYFKLEEGTLKAVDGVSFSVDAGETIGIIGESGCGKSVTAQSVLRIVPSPGHIASGQILLHRNEEDMQAIFDRAGTSQPLSESGALDLTTLNSGGPLARAIRGRVISMIFQEPMTSLSPVHTVGNQITEAILLHRTADKSEARDIALDMLDRVRISNPGQRIDEYPFQLSGGMRQRVMIAMALSCNPALLIADEPTTALDVTVQAQILDLLKELQTQFGMAIQYITHDLGVIAEISDKVVVMYLGRVVEEGSAVQIFKNPSHPYTRLLLKSIPKLGRRSRTRLEAIKGNVPIPLDPPAECGFFSRCPAAIAGKCNAYVPALVEIEPGHSVRCFLHSDEIEADEFEAGGPATRSLSHRNAEKATQT